MPNITQQSLKKSLTESINIPSQDARAASPKIHGPYVISSFDPRMETDSRSDLRQSVGDKASAL